MLWSFIRFSQLFVNEMYGDQCGEFVCEFVCGFGTVVSCIKNL